MKDLDQSLYELSQFHTCKMKRESDKMPSFKSQKIYPVETLRNELNITNVF